MSDRVPHRLGLAALVPLGVQASFGGDGVDDLPIGEGVTFPAEMGFQIPRGPGGAGPDDEPQPRLIQRRQVGRREHAGARPTTTSSSMPWAAWKASTIGTVVEASALLPSQQPTWRGKPARSTSRPTMT